ncbi:hypothetical protein GDO81_015760 [Engystomops pustulosus]|uniref:Uncharacterized protein n=1 Tax=Engystomops pustulosus TaxID=76066 RepID=A0AAV7AWY7_ENGPU|nr:hypothetical protein GDO81_015760 [Engystomops pustulosus]
MSVSLKSNDGSPSNLQPHELIQESTSSSMEGTFCWDCKFQQNIKEDIKDPKTLRDVGLDYNTTRTKGLMMQKPTGKSCENKDILLYAMKPFQIIASCQRTTLVSL